VKAYDSFEKVAQQVSAIVGDKGLNVLINNAGILPEGSRTTPFYTEEMAETYEVNTIAPTKLTKAFLPLLKKAGTTNCEGDYYVKKSLVVNMSSILGSIESTSSSFYLPYNCTKVRFITLFSSCSCN
jgi:short-subunit dehydrogenase